MTRPYAPIACAMVDELQLRALRGREVVVRWRDGDGPREAASRLADVRSREGAEWLVLADGRRIRLDDLIEVDGIAFDAGGC